MNPSVRHLTVASGRAFNSDPENAGYQVQVVTDADGTSVKVWDDVAGHYTLCHSLSERQRAYCRANAR